MFATADEICIEQQRTHSLYLNIPSDVIRLDVTAQYGTAGSVYLLVVHHVLNVHVSFTRLDDCRSSRMKELQRKEKRGKKRALIRSREATRGRYRAGEERERERKDTQRPFTVRG